MGKEERKIKKLREAEIVFEIYKKEKIKIIENNEHYDIIFMDIMMPEMSGVETLKKLKQMKNFNTPVVALTADAIQGRQTKYIEVGFNDYLSKPINKDELKRVLNKCLNRNIEITEEKLLKKVQIYIK